MALSSHFIIHWNPWDYRVAFLRKEEMDVCHPFSNCFPIVHYQLYYNGSEFDILTPIVCSSDSIGSFILVPSHRGHHSAYWIVCLRFEACKKSCVIDGGTEHFPDFIPLSRSHKNTKLVAGNSCAKLRGYCYISVYARYYADYWGYDSLGGVLTLSKTDDRYHTLAGFAE